LLYLESAKELHGQANRRADPDNRNNSDLEAPERDEGRKAHEQ